MSRSFLPALLCALLMLAACGDAPRPATPPAATATPSASAAPSPTSDNPAARLTLTADQLPPSPVGALTQRSDGFLAGHANTDARVFTDASESLGLEIDVLPDTSAAGATNDYGAVRDKVKSKVTKIMRTSSPNVGDQADEYAGTTADGKQIVGIAFQQGAVLVAVIIETTTGSSHADYVEMVGTAQAQKISSSS